MVARNMPIELPAGWTVNFKVLKSGRKLKYYTDLKSGKKFYSMNEVYRYMRSMDGNSFKIQQLHHCNAQSRPAVVARNFPDGLPEGWTVNCKVLNSGRKLKYYTDLKTGKKLYSMNEVCRYIKSTSGKSFKTRTSSVKCSKGSMKKYQHVAKKANSDLGWLPKGWLIEFRQYEAGPRTGKKYKVYIDKSTGHKVYSRAEVLRCLKRQNYKGHTVKEIKKAIVTRSKSCEYKNNSETKMEEHLSVVECDAHTLNKKKLSRTSRNASRRALSTSPATAQTLVAEAAYPKNSADKGTYVVRCFTMSDAHENGVQTRGSKRRQQSDSDNISTLTTSTANVLKGDNISSRIFEVHKTSKNRSNLPSRFSKRLARLEPQVAINIRSNDYAHASPAKRSYRDQKALPLSVTEKVNEQEKGNQSLSVTEVDYILKEENTVTTGKNSNDSSKNTKNNRDGRSRRFSKRLAGFEPEVASILSFSEKVVQGMGKRLCTDQAKSISASALSSVVHKSCQKYSAHAEQPDSSRCLLNKSDPEGGLEIHHSRGLGSNTGNTNSQTRHKRKSDETKQLAGVELDVVWDSVGEIKSRLPATSQDVRPETVGASKDQEMQQQSPIWHSWSDPCLEFAFKTLTGEISIEDDLQIESYFQQIKKPAQKDATLGAPEFSLVDAPQKSFPGEQPQPALGYNWINSQQTNGGDLAKIKAGNS